MDELLKPTRSNTSLGHGSICTSRTELLLDGQLGALLMVGREGGREGGRERARRDGWREGWRDGLKVLESKGGREGREREGKGKEVGREGGEGKGREREGGRAGGREGECGSGEMEPTACLRLAPLLETLTRHRLSPSITPTRPLAQQSVRTPRGGTRQESPHP